MTDAEKEKIENLINLQMKKWKRYIDGLDVGENQKDIRKIRYCEERLHEIDTSIEAYHKVVDAFGCRLKYDPKSYTYSIVSCYVEEQV